jgi:ABC-type branched-subunit amino acid transport system substrate-binding protein
MRTGPSTSDEALIVGSLLSNYNVSLISYAATADNIDNSNLFPFARTVPSDAAQAAAITTFMRTIGWTLVIPLFTNDTYGTSGKTSFTTEASRNRLRLTCTNTIPFGQTASQLQAAQNAITNSANCISSSIATVVLLFMDLNNAANVLQGLYKNPGTRGVTFFASDAWITFTDDPVNFALNKFPLSFLQGMSI